MDRLDSLSLNLEKNNIDKIKELFPEAVEEGKINFDMLRAMLGGEVDDLKEKYQFTWNGKAKSIKLAQTPSSATLRPCKDK
jgi:adenine-specific DNA-methyltransferase